jgi:hypothetical protein
MVSHGKLLLQVVPLSSKLLPRRQEGETAAAAAETADRSSLEGLLLMDHYFFAELGWHRRTSSRSCTV